MTNAEIAKKNRERVIDLLERFVDVSRTQIARYLFNGNTRAANRVLTSLDRAGRVSRFTMTLRGEYIYRLKGKGEKPTGQTPHHLDVSEIFTQLAKANASLQGWGYRKLSKELITDMLCITPHRAILLELHRASNPFGTKLDRYDAWAGGEKPEWHMPGMKKPLVWVVAPSSAIPWLERKAEPIREGGRVNIIVSDRELALVNPWRALQGFSTLN